MWSGTICLESSTVGAQVLEPRTWPSTEYRLGDLEQVVDLPLCEVITWIQ